MSRTEREAWPSRAAVADATRALVAGNLPTVAAVLAATFAVFAVMNLALHGGERGMRVLLIDGGAAVVLAAAWAMMRRAPVPPERAHAVAFGILGVAVLDLVLSGVGGPSGETVFYFTLALAAVGGIVLSWPWLGASALLVLAAWAFVATRGAPGSVGPSAVLVPLAGAGVAALVHAVRLRTYARLEALRLHDEGVTRALEATAAAARESESRYRALFEHASDAVFVLEPDGRVVDSNLAAEESLGYSRDAFRIMRVGDFVADSVPGRLAETHARLLADGPMTFESTHRRRDGSTFPVETRLALIEVAGRHLVLAAARDVAERKRGEEALRRSERLSAVGTLVAGVAHEINNPLAFMSASVQLTQEVLDDVLADEELPPRLRAVVVEAWENQDVVLGGIRRISGITHRLGRVASSSRATRDAVNVNVVVEDVLAVAQGRVGPPIALETRLDARSNVVANAAELSQVVLNLVLNAADALSGVAKPALAVRTLDAPGGVVIEVADTGIGMEPEAAARVFTPFHSTKPTGTGLGLSISHRIVEDHGGRITFETAPGRGTTFRVELPAAE